MKTLYTLIYSLALPFILLRFLTRNISDKTGRRKAGPRRRFFERFGFCPPAKIKGGIVFHMVSVGEALAAIKLVQDFQAQHSDIPITVTCTTQQGSKIIQDKLGNSVNHCYLPYDLGIFIRIFLQRIQPKTFIILETELWPNLVNICHAKNIALLLLNARLSQKSYEGYRKLGRLTSNMLKQFSFICSQAEADAERFRQLGLESHQISVTGNLKFDLQVDESHISRGQSIKQQLFQGRPVWIAASTHPGEDEILLNAHKQLRQHYPNLILVIAPRHIDRTDNICKLIEQQQFSYLVHSHKPQADDNMAVYLVNTIGELLTFYASADICFVGGSLIPHGGHNPIEPATLHKSIVAGPHNHNFQTIYDELHQKNAVIFVKDSSELVKTLQSLLQSAEERDEMGRRAYQYVTAHRGATAKMEAIIEKYHLGLSA